MTTTLFTTIDSPIGALLLLGDGSALHGLYMQDGPHPIATGESWRHAPEPFEAISSQLHEFFAGERRDFDVPLEMEGSPFQRRVWHALREIPYGETISYGELATRIGAPGAARAVGRANGSNPIAIIVPCHRVIGASGTLTGFGGGMERKRYLLEVEQGVAQLVV